MARQRQKPNATQPTEPTGDAIVQQPAAQLEAVPAGYAELLAELKQHIGTAQVRAAVAVTRELIALHWHIGQQIVQRQEREGWGKSVIDRLAHDLQQAFPGRNGFSPQNLTYMRQFYLAWATEPANSQQPVGNLESPPVPETLASIPWSHNILLVSKIKDAATRLWYARKTIENGWSRNTLAIQIDTRLHERQGEAVTNFKRTLPAPLSDLAQGIIKDPYVFDFLTLAEDAREKELEDGLLAHIQRFLLELGVGFAFVGKQYPLEVGGEDFRLDLLFYHCRLHCYFVIDLKMGAFEPEFAGKMNFYLSAVDEQVRDKSVDRPTLGLILCRERNRVIAEYALRGMAKPIGVAGFEARMAEPLPAELEGKLPSIERLEAELQRAEEAIGTNGGEAGTD